jgi:hypothetical protein
MTDLASCPPGESGRRGGRVAETDESSLTLAKVVVFGVAAPIIVLFVGYLASRPESFSAQRADALVWLASNFCCSVLTSASFVQSAAYLADSEGGWDAISW